MNDLMCSDCKICIHRAVCGKKDIYSAICDAVQNTVYPCGNKTKESAWLKDCNDVVVNVECQHYFGETIFVKGKDI